MRMTSAVNTVLADLPCRIKAYTIINKDMSYTIVINARMSYEMQLESYKHELGHIQRGDYEKKCSADLIEFYAHH